ncbi:MAG TPA: DUF6295 family protein [Natronosporangium sp.]|nr:DUF6295 family protein [Natronosporangium sp.]
MCTTISDHAAVSGSGKQGGGWFRVEHAHLAYDHPSHAAFEHALLLDFAGQAGDRPARLAVELSLDSARRLAEALTRTVEAAEAYERKLDEQARAGVG